VIVGKSAAQLEVAGDAGLIFNVTNAGALSDHLSHVLKEPERARQLSERALEQARRTSPDKVAGRVLDVLARLCTGQRHSGWSACADASRRTALLTIT
jgi:glycosyltransferase involved in cell wall biosynthesis